MSSNLTDADEIFDLDVLRGWKEVGDHGLRGNHSLPALAVLVRRTPDGRREELLLHGPETYIGRYHPQNGPVDVILNGLEDHEIYRLSAPHVRVVMSERGEWTVRPMTPAALTQLNGTTLSETRQQYAIGVDDVLRLGAVDFEFRPTGVTYNEWLQRKKSALGSIDTTTLFLKRAGDICGPRLSLDPTRRAVLGRSFPRSDELPSGPWRAEEQPDWNLAGLWEWERKFVGFRHAALDHVDDQWLVEPLSQRQRTFVNRVEILNPTPLMPGDEIALGSVLFHFHDPSDIRRSTEARTAEIPIVVNWREEQTSPRLQPIARDSGTHPTVGRRTKIDSDDDDGKS